MSGGSLLLVILFAGSLASLLVLLELLDRRSAAGTRDAACPAYPSLTPLLPALISAFLCLVGLLLLLPWAASLSSQGDTGLQTGIVFAILLAVGMLYASTRTEPRW
jgi:hypothetical protein